MQGGGEECPELVQPDRGGEHAAGDQGGLELQFDRGERPGGQQPAGVAVAEGDPSVRRDGAVGAGEKVAQAGQPGSWDAVTEPDEPRDGADEDGQGAQEQCVSRSVN